MQDLDDRTRVSDSRIELVSWSLDGTTYIGLATMTLHATATLKENSVGENMFHETWGDNSEPAHNICFRGSSAIMATN
jgi:hypothetical protein